METVKVSIIIPSLNVRDYICECLESAVNQTLQEIEILCVDARSTDGTREIIKEYARRDKRVRLLNDDKGSTGYANNQGVRESSGAYVAILEPDDYVDRQMYEKLFLAAKEKDCDAARADYQVFWGTGAGRTFLDKPAARQAGHYDRILSARQEKALFLNDMSTWAGIYKKDFLVRNRIWHNETPGASYQDNGFWFQVTAMAERLMYIPVSGYRYRLDNPGSSVHNPKKAYAICDEFDFIRRRLEEEKIFDQYRGIYSYMKYVRYMGSLYRICEELQLPFAERFCRELQEHRDRGEMTEEFFSPKQREQRKQLLASPKTFVEQIRQGQQALWDFLRQEKRVIQFGCGSDGIRFLSYMRERGEAGKIVCIADNNPKLQKGRLFGIPLVSPEEAKKRWPGCGYVITSLNYEAEIQRQLIKAGVLEEKIIAGALC